MTSLARVNFTHTASRSNSRVRQGLMSIRTMSSKADTIKSTVSSNKVVIYSKTFCPYCRKVKKLFNELKESPEVIELDELDDGKDLQDTLKSITGKGTVPQVFVNGHFVGGCDDTYAAHQAGKLKLLLDEISASKL